MDVNGVKYEDLIHSLVKVLSLVDGSTALSRDGCLNGMRTTDVSGSNVVQVLKYRCTKARCEANTKLKQEDLEKFLEMEAREVFEVRISV